MRRAEAGLQVQLIRGCWHSTTMRERYEMRGLVLRGSENKVGDRCLIACARRSVREAKRELRSASDRKAGANPPS